MRLDGIEVPEDVVMTACVADAPVAASERETIAREETVFDPLTGELVEVADRRRLLNLHERLEGVALEILTACRDIRRALVGSASANRTCLELYVPLEEQSIRMFRSDRHAQGDEQKRA